MLFKETPGLLNGDRVGVKFNVKLATKARLTRVSIQLVALDAQGGLLFALHNHPATEEVGNGDMAQLELSFRMPQGGLAKTTTVKYRVIVDWE